MSNINTDFVSLVLLDDKSRHEPYWILGDKHSL